MKRFLFISTAEGLPWGGSEVLWAKVAQVLLRQGHHVAFSYQYFPDEPGVLADLRRVGAVAHYRENPRASSLLTRISRKVRRLKLQKEYPAFVEPHWLLSLVMEQKPDHVILNACDAYLIWPLANVFRQIRAQGIPYSILCHLEDESQMLFPEKREALATMYEGAAMVGFGARFGADMVMRQLAVPLRHIEIFDNPPNCSGIMQAWPSQKDECRFACVGRLDVTAKGQDIILAAFAGETWRTRNWRLTFYGKGWEEAHLRKLASMYGIGSRVHFAGFKPDVDAIWAEEHICLQPSPKEGTPMTVVEAMFAGRPCIVSDIGRMPDLISEGKTGWVCSRGVPSLSAALERAWIMRNDWLNMGRVAHETICRNWNRDYLLCLADRFLELT